MDSTVNASEIISDIECLTIKPTRYVPDLKEDVHNNLLSSPRSLPSKYFYDERGADLFNRICHTPEYYPTRTEQALLKKVGTEIIAQTRPDHIIELGSGNSRKTKTLFDACERQNHLCTYLPFDICEPELKKAAVELRDLYQWLDIKPMLGDYHAGLDNLPKSGGIEMYLFLGGTIGNFIEEDAQRFLYEIENHMSSGDYLLLGADRVKEPSVLNAAYNDSQGLTAMFNLNVLQVLNRELGANFIIDNFAHEAIYNGELNRIEMYLISKINQRVTLNNLGAEIELEMNERILTELSHKYQRSKLESMFSEPGLDIVQHFEPGNQYYSLLLLQCH